MASTWQHRSQGVGTGTADKHVVASRVRVLDISAYIYRHRPEQEVLALVSHPSTIGEGTFCLVHKAKAQGSSWCRVKR
jgi:hypothetical protein